VFEHIQNMDIIVKRGIMRFPGPMAGVNDLTMTGAKDLMMSGDKDFLIAIDHVFIIFSP
jgi:hypothetical protein